MDVLSFFPLLEIEMRIDIENMKERGFTIDIEEDAIYIGPKRFDKAFFKELEALCVRAGLGGMSIQEVAETISDLQIIEAIRS